LNLLIGLQKEGTLPTTRLCLHHSFLSFFCTSKRKN